MKGIKKKGEVVEEKPVKKPVAQAKPEPAKAPAPKKSAVKGFEEEDPSNDELDDLLDDDDLNELEDDEADEIEDDEEVEEEEIEDDEPEEEEVEEQKPKNTSEKPKKASDIVKVEKTEATGFTVGKPTQIWVSCSAKITTRQYENADFGTGITLTLPENATKADAETAREEAWNYCQEFVNELTQEIRKLSKAANSAMTARSER